MGGTLRETGDESAGLNGIAENRLGSLDICSSRRHSVEC
jgi:hypothetical protein